MSLEIKDGNPIPKEEIVGVAKNLFQESLDILAVNQGLMLTLTEKYLKQSQLGTFATLSRRAVEFKSNDLTYQVDLQRDPLCECIRISKFQDSVEEKIEIWIGYEEGGDKRSAFPKRGEVEFSHVSHLTFDWTGSANSIFIRDNQEAVEKIKTFFEKLKIQ